MSKNTIKFLIPLPVQAKKGGKKLSALAMKRPGGLDFSLKTPGFKSQFHMDGDTILPEPVELQLHIISAALDCGYGGGSKELLDFCESDWLKIQRYLRAKGEFLLTIFESATTKPDYLRRSAIATVIETTESSDVGYLFGSVMCRLANEVWAKKYRSSYAIKYFWHVKVAKDKAVNLTKSFRAKGSDNKNVENPDFLIKLENSGWYTSEAKGTLGDVKWGDVKEGLIQAAKFEKIQVFDLAAKKVHATSKIRAYSCTMAHFSKTDGYALRVLHVDPEPGSLKPNNTVCVVPQFADLVVIEQAIAQFEGMSNAHEIKVVSPQSLFTGYSFRPLVSSGVVTEPIWIGIPDIFLTAKLELSEALCTLRIIVPYVQDLIHGTQGAKRNAKYAAPDDDAFLMLLRKVRGDHAVPIYDLVQNTRQQWLPPDSLHFEEDRAKAAQKILRKVFSTSTLTAPESELHLSQSISDLHKRLVLWISQNAHLYSNLKLKLNSESENEVKCLIRFVSNGLLLLSGNPRLRATEKVKVVKI